MEQSEGGGNSGSGNNACPGTSSSSSSGWRWFGLAGWGAAAGLALRSLFSDSKEEKARKQVELAVKGTVQLRSHKCPHEGANMCGPDCPAEGTGFLLADSFVLTCAHVVKTYRPFLVAAHDGTVSNGLVIHLDHKLDLALIQLNEPLNMPIMELDPSTVKLADPIYAMGAPNGILGHSVVPGIISFVKRKGSDLPGLNMNPEIEYLQISAPFTGGYSGGPVVRQGKVIGVLKSTMQIQNPCTTVGHDGIRRSLVNTDCPQEVRGVGFAIPIKHAIDFIRRAKERDRAREMRRSNQQNGSPVAKRMRK